MTDLLATIKMKSQSYRPGDLVELIGYRQSQQTKAVNRLNLLLSVPSLLRWYDQSGFDFKYSNREFLLKLGDVLNIPQAEVTAGITATNKEQVRIVKMFQPYIFIDTNFKRQSQPIFVLAFLEGRRHINISRDDVLRDKEAELKRIQRIVIQHYRDNKGSLNLWGKIQRYIYVFDVNQQWAILPNGEVSNTDRYRQQRASLTLKGKDICPLIGAVE